MGQQRFDEPPLSFAQYYDGYFAVLQILLTADIFVRSA
jgi:hypothetical protein